MPPIERGNITPWTKHATSVPYTGKATKGSTTKRKDGRSRWPRGTVLLFFGDILHKQQKQGFQRGFHSSSNKISNRWATQILPLSRNKAKEPIFPESAPWAGSLCKCCTHLSLVKLLGTTLPFLKAIKVTQSQESSAAAFPVCYCLRGACCHGNHRGDHS